MGGPGSGGWYRWDKKLTVNNGLTLDINQMVREGLFLHGQAKVIGSIKWTNIRTDEQTGAMGFIIEPRGNDGLIFRVSYTIARREGDKQDFDYPLELQTTRPHYGGRRWWFTCPLVVNGLPCNRRVSKLYLPTGAKYLGCRHCYDLTYRSCQESDKRVDRLVRNPEALMAAATSPGLKYALLALKAFDKIEQQSEKEERRRQGKRRGRPRKQKRGA